MSEVFTCDLPSPIKHHYPALRSAYSRIEEAALRLPQVLEEMKSGIEEFARAKATLEALHCSRWPGSWSASRPGLPLTLDERS